MKAIFAVMNTTGAVVNKARKTKKKRIYSDPSWLVSSDGIALRMGKVMGSLLAWKSWTNKTLWFLRNSKGGNGVCGINTPGMRIGNTHEWDSVADNSSMKSLMKPP